MSKIDDWELYESIEKVLSFDDTDDEVFFWDTSW